MTEKLFSSELPVKANEVFILGLGATPHAVKGPWDEVPKALELVQNCGHLA